jgi:hypothetical protein
MLTLNSAEGFFKRARERGAKNETDIINDEEVKKELQPETKNNYRRAAYACTQLSSFLPKKQSGELIEANIAGLVIAHRRNSQIPGNWHNRQR